MQTDLINIGLGFLEGLALIISPCILPILPILLAGSLTGSKKRPFGIITGFVFIFALVTYFSRKLIQLSGIDLNLIRHVSFIILLALGIVMLSSYLTDKFNRFTQRIVNLGSGFSTFNNPEGGFISGIIFGGLIAIIWTPCAGPILAAVIVQTVIQHTTFLSFMILIAFSLGASIPMLVIALFGRTIMSKFNYFKTNSIFFRKTLGLIIIISVGYMMISERGINIISTAATASTPTINLQNSLSNQYKSPPITGIDAWINSKPLQIKELKGKVVLIDFWTYSCINCMRTIPYLNDWYSKYHDHGLVIIGVHTPEFEFEKSLNNVKNAVAQDGIKYPVALDNQFLTWLNYNNQYWPAHYLIDKNGYVVYTHFGEGDYGITENNIRYLLNMREEASTNQIIENPVANDTTPETYLGYDRADNFASRQSFRKDKSTDYTFPPNLSQNEWALQGNWKIMPDRIISEQNNAAIKINFHARKVYIVMGAINNKNIKIDVLLNGKKITSEKGKDILDNGINVNKHTIYEIITLTEPSTGILQIISSEPGLEVYTFTFG